MLRRTPPSLFYLRRLTAATPPPPRLSGALTAPPSRLATDPVTSTPLHSSYLRRLTGATPPPPYLSGVRQFSAQEVKKPATETKPDASLDKSLKSRLLSRYLKLRSGFGWSSPPEVVEAEPEVVKEQSMEELIRDFLKLVAILMESELKLVEIIPMENDLKLVEDLMENQSRVFKQMCAVLNTMLHLMKAEPEVVKEQSVEEFIRDNLKLAHIQLKLVAVLMKNRSRDLQNMSANLNSMSSLMDKAEMKQEQQKQGRGGEEENNIGSFESKI